MVSKKIVLVLVLLIGAYISISAADEFMKKKIEIGDEFLKSKVHPKIESNLLKPGVFGTGVQEATIKAVIELNGTDESYESYLKSLEEKGAVIEAVHKNKVQVSVPASQIQSIADLPFVNYVRSPRVPYKDVVVSEGVEVINASKMHSMGFNGSGVKIAIIDLGFSGYMSKLGTELPESVTVKSFRQGGDIEAGENHGTAVAEIVYDVAPNASLYFINFDSDIEFASAVDYAISQNVDIISMSVNWLAGPFDGTGDITEIVDNATSNGITWVNSAGNYAQRHWEGKFNGNIDNLTYFVPDDELNSLGYLSPGSFVAVFLSWDDWPVSYQDYDLYLINEKGMIINESVNDQSKGYPPYEGLVLYIPKLDNYSLAIHRYSATRDVNFELYSVFHNLQYKVPSSSLGIPADARDIITAGATRWSDDALELFSSRGPSNDGRTKPDLVAPDGVSTATYGSKSFYGTSASAPHTAGAAALLLSANGSLTRQQVKDALESGAKDLGIEGKDNETGAGRIDVWNAYLQIQPQQGCTGDQNGDSKINFNDFVMFAYAYNTHTGDANYNVLADLNSNGVVDFNDFTVFASVYGVICTP